MSVLQSEGPLNLVLRRSHARLPQDVQHAVCNLNIRLDNFLYSHWDDGSWYVVSLPGYASSLTLGLRRY